MSIQISSHEKKRAACLNHWDESEGFLGGLDLQLGLDEELVQLSFVKAWVMEAEEESFVGSVVCFQIVLSRSSFEAYHKVSIYTQYYTFLHLAFVLPLSPLKQAQ